MVESLLVGVLVVASLLIAWFSARAALRLVWAPAPRTARGRR